MATQSIGAVRASGASSCESESLLARDVVEIFQTPLRGAYDWSYHSSNAKLARLYRLGKKLNWNSDHDIDWDVAVDFSQNPLPGVSGLKDFSPYEQLSEERKLEYAWRSVGWMLSQFLHGEQGALLVASQLVSSAPNHDAKLFAASQTFDEARHVEVFTRYLRERVRREYPVSPHLKSILDKLLTDPRWDLKFVGMQIVIEGLALAAFHTLQQIMADPTFRQAIGSVIRDESRHVAFGVNYLEAFIADLSEEEREDRASFAFEACRSMRERALPRPVFAEFGFDVEAACEYSATGSVMAEFQRHLFSRVVPNLRKVGLLTERIRPRYERLGVLQFESLPHDGQIDWSSLDAAIPSSGTPSAPSSR